MSHTATIEKDHTPACDGWSRGNDGVIRTSERRAFQVFGALKHDHGHAPGYALNLVVSRGMGYEEFLAVNDIETEEV